MQEQLVRTTLQESINVKQSLLNLPSELHNIGEIAEACIRSLSVGGKILFCGNGGSAADAQHLAAELTGRFYFDRRPLFAEALHVNTSYITAVANDYSYDEIYSRLVTAKGRKGDVLIGMSTSGNSENVVKALQEAKNQEMITIGMTGESGGKMAAYCDILFKAPSSDTPRIQECHMWAGHTICQIIEMKMFTKS